VRDAVVDELLTQVASLKDELATMKTAGKQHNGAPFQPRSSPIPDARKANTKRSTDLPKFKFVLAQKHRKQKPFGSRFCGYCIDAAIAANTMNKDDMPADNLWFASYDELNKHLATCNAFKAVK
jgi:hypothetical protein